MMRPLVRGAHHLSPQYLADSIREAKCTYLRYKTKLSRLRTLDPPPSVLVVPRGDHP
jgi:hypothetical protein